MIFIIPFIIMSIIFLLLSYFCEGKADYKLAILMGVAFGLISLGANYGYPRHSKSVVLPVTEYIYVDTDIPVSSN